jgi:transposase-like protein
MEKRVSRKKQRRRQYTGEFKRQAVERMKLTDNIVKLAQELGIQRPLLYQWEAAAEGRGRSSNSKRAPGSGPRKENESELREEVNWLREVLAKKVKEADFFRGALQKVEARRQRNARPGAAESTTKSEN